MIDCNDGVKDFYNMFSKSYGDYANGTSVFTDLLELKESDAIREFSWGDLQTWQTIEDSLNLIIESRQAVNEETPLQVLDVGCGDGIWALRIAHYCLNRSVPVEIACLDLSAAMLDTAKAQFNEFLMSGERPHIEVTYELCDLAQGLPSKIKSTRFDIALCLHTVLNHLQTKDLSFAIGELIHASSGFLHFSVKPPFSRPTFYASPMSEVLHFERKNEHLFALDRSGDFHIIRSNLISREQLQDALSSHAVRTTYIGLDVLISRFTLDPRWVGDNPTAKSLPIDDLLSIEARASLDSRYLNYANHILTIVDTRLDF